MTDRTPARPNIVLLTSHDTGRYAQPYGHAIATPNIQRIASEGVFFRQAFCGNPTCSASRACLMSGRSAHANGMLGLAHRGFRMNDYDNILPRRLAAAGYHTVLSGFQHIIAWNDADQLGHNRVLTTKPAEADRAAAEFLVNAPSEPFYLEIGFSETHRKFPEPHPDDNPDFCLPPAPIPDLPETRYDMACFKASARRLDDRIGRVLEALDRAGLSDRTLVVCTTDHGIAFPRMKCNLTEGGIGVMLAVRGPGGFEGGRALDALVSHVDLYPTLLEMAGAPVPAETEGRSLLPLVRGETDSVRDAVYAEVNFHAAPEPQRCVRTDRYKYICRYDGRTSPVLPNCDASPSKTAWLDAGWRSRAPEPEMLYDLRFDPVEASNLIGDPDYVSVLKDMRRRLVEWQQATRDPILDGPLALPEGVRLTDPDADDPEGPLLDESALERMRRESRNRGVAAED